MYCTAVERRGSKATVQRKATLPRTDKMISCARGDGVMMARQEHGNGKGNRNERQDIWHCFPPTNSPSTWYHLPSLRLLNRPPNLNRRHGLCRKPNHVLYILSYQSE